MGEVIFVSGIYGTGKSFVFKKISKSMGIPIFDCSFLIKSINNENYSFDKSVKDKEINQLILIEEVKKLLKSNNRIFLTGHFCIFDKEMNIVDLPDFVYNKLSIKKIINLEAPLKKVINNLLSRDKREYSRFLLDEIQAKERNRAMQIASKYKIVFTNYILKYTNEDQKILLKIVREMWGCFYENTIRHKYYYS